MDIQASKIELVKMILSIENVEFISKISDFIKKESSNFWEDLALEEKNEIEKGIDQLNKGEKVAFSDFMKKIS